MDQNTERISGGRRRVVYGGVPGICASDFCHNTPVNGAPQTDELVLIVRRHPIPWRLDQVEVLVERFKCLQDHLVILVMVGGDPQPPFWLENAPRLGEKARVDEATLVMLLLGPGIRKVHVHGVHRLGGDEKFDEFTSVPMNEPQILQLPPTGPAVGKAKVFAGDFDTDKVVRRSTLGGIEQESALAEAEFDLNRVIIGKKGRQIQDRIVVRFFVELYQQG